MNEVKSGVIRRIAVQVKQRQRRHRAHPTSICEHACEANSPRGKMKTPPRGGASMFLYCAALAILLATLLVTTLLLLAGLLLTATLLTATLLTATLLTTLLLLAGLLVRVLILIHFSLSNMVGSALITRAP